jgi:hypothetical protein
MRCWFDAEKSSLVGIVEISSGALVVMVIEKSTRSTYSIFAREMRGIHVHQNLRRLSVR